MKKETIIEVIADMEEKTFRCNITNRKLNNLELLSLIGLLEQLKHRFIVRLRER